MRAIDISQLTRPARIRRRPQLFPQARHITSTLTACRSSVNATIIKRRSEIKSDNIIPAYGPEREQVNDYQMALRMNVKKPRKVKLPTIRDPKSFQQDLIAASSSKSSLLLTQPSTKGKEKEITCSETLSVEEEAANRWISEKANKGPRRNPVGVQMLSPLLQAQLFPGDPLPKPPPPLLKISINHLQDNGLSPKDAAISPELNFNIPPLRGRNIRDHFYFLGQCTAEPWAQMAKDFMRTKLPEKPRQWVLDRPGWTKYHLNGTTEVVDDLGDETMVSFDVEVLYKLSKYPVMATAVTPNAWYSWLSPTIFRTPPSDVPELPPPWEVGTPEHHPHELIPLFNPNSSIPRIVIGHNVGYDRARVREEYALKRTQTRWIDTLSLHVATRGITSVQRPAWMAYRKNKKAKVLRNQENFSVLQELAEESGDETMMEVLQQWNESEATELESSQKRWEEVTSMNSLAEVAALHCGYPVDKSIRDRFGEEGIQYASQLVPELHELLAYCANDVAVTHEVYTKVFALFLESCPHPATLSGVLSMGNSFLPVDQSWREYLRNAEEKYREMNEGVKKSLRLLAEKQRMKGPKDGDSDPWSWQLDWAPKNARWSDYDFPSPEGSSTGEFFSLAKAPAQPVPPMPSSSSNALPQWLLAISQDHSLLKSSICQRYLLPLLLRLSYKGHAVAYLSEQGWCFMVPHDRLTEYIDHHGSPHMPGTKDKFLEKLEEKYVFFRIGKANTPKKIKLVGPGVKPLVKAGELTSPYPKLLHEMSTSNLDGVIEELWECIEDLKEKKDSEWGQQLDWMVSSEFQNVFHKQPISSLSSQKTSQKKPKSNHGTWPKWYWDLTGPPNRLSPGTLDLTCKKTIASLLLRLQWQGYPLVYSKEHKWCYRIPRKIWNNEDGGARRSRGPQLKFQDEGPDAKFRNDREHVYFRLPHKDGEGKNVGNPLSKSFVKAIESGELSSAAANSGDDVAAKAAVNATNMNAFCSYWISSRERIMDQMVVYKDQSQDFGMILPQVITMGTVTRRAVEATWLTASNAKKNRVGSELKAMIRAPTGYSIVGADVDSEELWISSVMGDSQFGMHGATAIGWMTLEGTKSAGTDLHSKTANILGISRDAAKVFNYSRIYGAGKKHAVQLLLQGDSKLTKETAGKLADELYKSTKGSKAMRSRHLGPASISSMWHGGSESYLFNTLETIALSDRPTTPALGCGVTRALRKSYLEEGSSYLPSRVNWVVQSSGVDYLHLLIVSMEYLIRKYDIQARYLISVHDEVRYLAKEEDRYRAAMALQIANAWTRALFCYNLGIDDMPQGIAFFSAVDIDHVLRKEVFLTCETPSHPKVIPAGESLDIVALLKKVPDGNIGQPIPDTLQPTANVDTPMTLFPNIQSKKHQYFLEAQANKGGSAAKHWLNGLPFVDLSDFPMDQMEESLSKPRVKTVVRRIRD
ncbi:uncharacterized protein L203_104187 [Cryptococcus depauperatus CBS 7841]|uniref:Mitochondrial DNA polymerase catalytic subunit n=1 Tax=Cryptococcus depauperatus CBS 7841 TaxID=1295531 RepID=A0AAJ8JV21_9TREE